MTSKRQLKARIEALEEMIAPEDDRDELLLGPGIRIESEPQLTERLAARGFIVEREVRTFATDYEDVLLQTTPSAPEILHDVLWHAPGPTAPRADVCIDWIRDPRETVIEAAKHPVRWTAPDLPAEPAVVASDESWMAVVPADQCLDYLVMRRGRAERSPYEIREPVEVSLDHADDYDLVTVDAPPDADRHPHIDAETH